MSSSSMDHIFEDLLTANDRYVGQAAALSIDLKSLVVESDYTFLKEALQQYLDETQQFQQQLRGALERAIELEAIQARRELYNEHWWQQKRQALYKAFKADAQNGWAQWLRTYVEALLDWQISICKRLVTDSFAFPVEVVSKLAMFQEGTQAIENENYLQALDMLQAIIQMTGPDLGATEATSPQSAASATNRAAVLVLIGRIYLYKSFDEKRALVYFEQARSLAPEDGLPCAALASYYQTSQGSEQANQAPSLYQRAIELSPTRPDGYIGLGLLAEDRSAWDEAADWYREAAETVQEENSADLAVRKMLAPVSGNLYLELARVMKKKDPNQALAAIERALFLGVRHDGDYPDRLAYTLKGEILEGLQKSIEAAQAHYEAGRRYAWRNECEAAKPILEHAKVLDPTNTYIDLELSDVFRVCSYKPEYPYVNKDAILSSVVSWQICMAADLFATNKTWLYSERALINEQLVRIPTYNSWELYWESIAYLERAYLLESDSNILAYLARNYRSVELNINALLLTDEALAIVADNAVVLEERIGTLATLGDLDATEQVIEQRQQLGESTWVDMIRAFILMGRGRYADARMLLLSLYEKSKKDLWYHILYADSCFLTGELEVARKNYAWIWNSYDKNDAENLSTFGWSAYNLALLASDEETFTKFLTSAIEVCNTFLLRRKENPLNVGNILRLLGLCNLAQGNIVQGEQFLLEGIALAITARELDDMLNMDMVIIQRHLHYSSHKEQIMEVINRLKVATAETKPHLQQASASEELLNILTTYAQEARKTNWIWIAARAGLARDYLKEGRWSDALTLYLLLEKEHDRFPEASIGLQKTFDDALGKGNTALKEGKLLHALDVFKQLFEVNIFHDDKEKQGALHCRLGYVYSKQLDVNRAYEHFTLAIQCYREHDAESAVATVAQTCRTLLHNASDYWTLDDTWAVIVSKDELGDNLRGDFETIRKLLSYYLEEFYRLSDLFVDREKFIPVAKSIILEIGDGLVPEDTSPNWSLFKTYIPEMRQRILTRMGVNVPGISVQQVSNLKPDDYRIFLDAAEVAAGSVYANMGYCPVSQQILQDLGIPDDQLIEMRQPVSGEPGCWVLSPHWPLLLEHDIELWTDPMAFILSHVEVVLLRNLAMFCGVQEAENLLQEGKVASTLTDPYARRHFIQIIRALLKQSIPIAAWETALEHFQEARLFTLPVHEAVELLRPYIKQFLPGNAAGAVPLVMPPEWENDFLVSLASNTDASSLVVPPEALLTFLATVREAVKARDWNVVLLVQHGALRPFIQQLVRTEFPYLAVLSGEEWLSEEERTATHMEGTATHE